MTYEGIEDHFKYGSTGGERESGFPYWIFQAMPQVCAHHLPGTGYASLGFIYEPDKDLPVGMSKRRHMGIDRVFLNCAVCHASTVRTSAQAPAQVYTAMPAHRFDLHRFEKFVFDCVADERFSGEHLVPVIDRMSGGLSLLDRYCLSGGDRVDARTHARCAAASTSRPISRTGARAGSVHPARCCSTGRCSSCRRRNWSARPTRSGTRPKTVTQQWLATPA